MKVWLICRISGWNGPVGIVRLPSVKHGTVYRAIESYRLHLDATSTKYRDLRVLPLYTHVGDRFSPCFTIGSKDFTRYCNPDHHKTKSSSIFARNGGWLRKKTPLRSGSSEIRQRWRTSHIQPPNYQCTEDDNLPSASILAEGAATARAEKITWDRT